MIKNKLVIIIWIGLIITAAITIKAKINFEGILIPGINGGYYPLQVRILLEKGHLGFVDLPLVFWLEAIFSNLIAFITKTDINSSIIYASKILDTFIPPLAAIPVALISKEIFSFSKWKPIYLCLPSAFSVLSFSPLILTSDFQKNALGIVWLFCLIYSLIKFQECLKRKYLVLAIVYLILCGLTHFGCFSIALFFTVTNIVAYCFFNYKTKSVIKYLSIILLLVTLGFSLLFVLDKTRAFRMILFPVTFFKEPIILSILIKKAKVPPTDLFNLVFTNLFLFLTIFLLYKKSKLIPRQIKPFIFTTILFSLFLAFPLMGKEWAGRLLLMAFVPTTILIGLVISLVNKLTIKRLLTGLIVLVIFLSVIFVLNIPHQPAISVEAFNELKKLKDQVEISDKTLIVARHGLEWWTAWALDVKVVQDKALIKEDWKKYDRVLFLEQLKGKSAFGPQGSKISLFPEPKIPRNAELIFINNYYRLYEAEEPKDFIYFSE